jgi:hypothetical protein
MIVISEKNILESPDRLQGQVADKIRCWVLTPDTDR